MNTFASAKISRGGAQRVCHGSVVSHARVRERSIGIHDWAPDFRAGAAKFHALSRRVRSDPEHRTSGVLTTSCCTVSSKGRCRRSITPHVSAIRTAMHVLATRMQAAHTDARQGDLFTPESPRLFEDASPPARRPDPGCSSPRLRHWSGHSVLVSRRRSPRDRRHAETCGAASLSGASAQRGGNRRTPP